MPELRPLIAGNWKMNGLRSSIVEIDGIIAGAVPAMVDAADLLICPPVTLLQSFAERAQGTPLLIGAQDCHTAARGAHTGDISAEMLADAGARFIIVGHSERRCDHAETSQIVCEKAKAVLRAGLCAIICVGESRAERESGAARDIVAAQLLESIPEQAPAESLVIAYEPVWAIGTGLVPSCEQIGEMHADIRRLASAKVRDGESVRILYGGSVKPDNARAIFAVADVNGALIGGASLKASDFLAIATASLR